MFTIICVQETYLRAYYPTLDDIRNHISKAKKALQLSVIDQENALKKIEQWSSLSPSSHHYFRPYKESKADECQDPGQSYEESFLWVHQEPWQQDLMVIIWKYNVVNGCYL